MDKHKVVTQLSFNDVISFVLWWNDCPFGSTEGGDIVIYQFIFSICNLMDRLMHHFV